jgi:GNAT superfamily N-acetyltransferase
MAALPIEGKWSIKLLADADAGDALQFLQRDPLINIYLISRLLEETLTPSAHLVEVRHDGCIVLIASLATNIVLASAPGVAPAETATAIAIIAERILTRALPVRAIISPLPLVERLWAHLRARIDPPTVVRMTQPIYAITPGSRAYPDLTLARYSSLGDLDALVPACAAMHREEVGIDPMERDAIGYRERIRDLIATRRSIVRTVDGRIASKCEYSAVTDDAVQLMGVWTAPQFRRRGLSSATLREVCGHLFRQSKIVTLFVNDFNTPAIALYESLGFQRIGVNRALIW